MRDVVVCGVADLKVPSSWFMDLWVRRMKWFMKTHMGTVEMRAHKDD